MKYIIIILFLNISIAIKAQYPTQVVPTQLSVGLFEQGWHRADSGHILATRPPNFSPRLPGVIIMHQDAGTDTTVKYWTGSRWLKLLTTIPSMSVTWGSITGTLSNQTDLQNALNLKLNKTDTTNKWITSVFRKTGTDSVFYIKGGVTIFAYKDSINSGSGSGTVTSVGLSVPSAFNVSGSPITTNGTISISGAGTSGQYVRGNGTLGTFDTAAIPSFSAKVRSLFSGSSPISYNQATGTFTLADLVTSGSCINCNITFNSKGQAILYSNGNSNGITNADAPGDSLLIGGDTLKRINVGFGISSIISDSNITHLIDTSRITGIPTYFALDSLKNITGLTEGSVTFIDPNGVLIQDNANLFWDNSNKYLGINTNTPFSKLHVAGNTPNLPTALFGNFNIQSFNNTNGFIASNMYFDGTDVRYLQNGEAAWFQMAAGDILFVSAPSGSAGASAVFTTNLTVKNDGTVNIADLAGSGTRVVTASSTGDLGTTVLGNTLYSGDGTLAGNRSVNANNLNLTFDDLNTLKINYDFFGQAKANGNNPYTSAIGTTAGNYWQFAYTPTLGTFSRGIGVVVDTLNNVGLGSNPLVTMPLYNTGNSAFINGLQSFLGNFYRVGTITTDGTLTPVGNFYVIDASGGNITITLPAASTCIGAAMGWDAIFKRIDNSLANTVTIQVNATPGTDKIDGASSFTLTTQYESKRIRTISTSAFALY